MFYEINIIFTLLNEIKMAVSPFIKKSISITILVMFYLNNFAQVLKSVSPLKVFNDKELDIIFQIENYPLTKRPKPEILFSPLTYAHLGFQDKNPIILNDSMLKVKYDPNGYSNFGFKITNEQELAINIKLMDERGNTVKIIHPFKLSVIYDNAIQGLLVDSGYFFLPFDTDLYPMNIVAKVTNDHFKTHFTHPSTKVFIKSLYSKATIKVDSFKAENDSVMRIYFTLLKSIEILPTNFNYYYYVSIENEIDGKIISDNSFYVKLYPINYSTTETYTSVNRGDTGNIYTFYFQKKYFP